MVFRRSEKPFLKSFDGVTGQMRFEVTGWQKHKIFYVFPGAVPIGCRIRNA